MSKLTLEELTSWLQTLTWEEVELKVAEKGLKLLPALIDTHVHFRIPGSEQKEDWRTGSSAAIHGGLCGVVDMPNNNPAIVSKQVLEDKIKVIDQQKAGPLRVYQYLGARNQGELDLSCVDEVIGLKIYYGSSTGDLLVNQPETLERIYKQWPSLITVHAEEEELIQINSEKYKDQSGAAKHSMVRSPEVAVKAIESILQYVRKYKKPTLFAHISTQQELEVLAKAKEEGLPVYVEVSPHHLFLNESHYKKWGNFVKVNPPLRTVEDNRALWDAINSGLVDTIATDHAPHLPSEKEQSYEKAPSGIPEVDTVVPLMLDAVNKGLLSLDKLVELMHTNPINIFKIDDFQECGVVVDMEQKKQVDKSKVLTKCGWTPYHSQELQGWPIYTIIDKQIINI